MLSFLSWPASVRRDNNGCQLGLTGIFSRSRLTSWTSAKVKLEFFIAQTDWFCLINNCIWCVLYRYKGKSGCGIV